ncbi:NAD-binding protein [Mycena sanguinolenta]|nr:NAD-binding protein [Mycena sanguinolenta]
MSSKGVALVTGAAQGIGRSIALRLAEDGFSVVVNDLSSNAENLQTLADEIQKKEQKCSHFAADVSQEEQVKAMVEHAVEAFGSLDVMVANAGILGSVGPLIELSTEQWDRVLAVNARGTFLCYKYAGMQMIKQGHGGRIIGACSLAGKRGVNILTAYSASKYAIRGITQAAALEFGPHNITVNAYAPGCIKTPALAEMDPSEGLDLARSMSPFKQVGVPEDIASLVSFLASKESQFMTGQSISINGAAFFD